MAEEKKGFFKRLVSGLTKTRDNIVAGFDSLFTGYSTIDDDFYEELEEILIMGDIGINATTAILDKLKDQVEIRNIKDPKECKQLLIDTIKEQMTVDSTEYEFENRKSVILVIGVNGVGKTTSVGKLAGKLKDQGKKVILGAADTFRAAAGEQLTQWANRAGVEEESYGRASQDLPYSGEGISGSVSGNSGGSGWNDRTERTCAGKTVCRGGECNRYHSYQA